MNEPPGGGSLPRLTLWNAYAELMEKEPAFQPRYLALLDELAKSPAQNGLVQAALGARDLRQDSTAAAITHFRRALELGFTSSRVYLDLAEALARSGAPEDAVAVLKQGIRMEPYAPEIYKSLALRYITLKKYPLAKQTMQEYVDLFPEDDFMRGLLAKAVH
jgi:predicted Zn-dependent protease